MSDREHREIFIIKRHPAHDEGHHGGAWKIAFADFMTAMMALFLVLWLISSTSEKTKHAVAQYFNPVKLVDMTTLKKGFRDPLDTEMGPGPNPKESRMESDSQSRSPSSVAREAEHLQKTGAAAIQREGALFADPFAVLAEIIARAPMQSSNVSENAASSVNGLGADPSESFEDPFATAARELERGAWLASTLDGEARGVVDEVGPSGGRVAATLPPRPTSMSAQSQARPHDGADEVPAQASLAKAAKLKSEIVEVLNNGAKDIPGVDVQQTAEGMLISLADANSFSMFAVGSAEPSPKTVQVMEKIGLLLKARPGSIVVRGHTDGRPFKSAAYDNWRLSSARAQMALYMLVRGGLSENRVERIEGHAEHHLRAPQQPLAPENRRIEILLRKDGP